MNALKSIFFDVVARLQYGTSRPESVVPPAGPSPVFLNPSDRRAIKKLVHDSVRRRTSVPIRFWRGAVKRLKPNLALDVGANYGECFASSEYPPATRIVAVEANPGLIQYLEKTRAAHPAARQIKVANCLISDRPAAAQTFYFQSEWTGGGTAVVPGNPADYQQVQMPVDCLDNLLQQEKIQPGGSLLLKADVEGYEGMMFRGFQSLANFSKVAGIFEFDTALLARAGTPPREVFERLAAKFQMFGTKRHHSTLRPIQGWNDLVAERGDEFHTDLVILSSEAELPAGWTIERHS